MNDKKAVLAALEHKHTFPVPYQIDFTIPALKNMADFYGNEAFQEEILDNSLVLAFANQPWEKLEPGIYRDGFGSIWNKKIDRDIGVIENVVVTPENVTDFEFPDVENPGVYQNARDLASKQPDKMIMYIIGFSLYERAWILGGMETVLMAMAADPNFVHTLMDRITEYNLTQIKHACEAGVDAVWFGDDWGQQSGLIMGPKHWREFIKPRLKIMYDAVKAYDKKVFIHCCGKVDEILPDFIELGIDLFNPFQPEVTDVYQVKKQFGKEISFWGGISTQRLLPFGTPDEVKDEVKRLLDNVGKDGGYIAAPAHAIPGDAKPENVNAMIEVLNNQ
jgi:uroporphyrinogen decarboxylase